MDTTSISSSKQPKYFQQTTIPDSNHNEGQLSNSNTSSASGGGSDGTPLADHSATGKWAAKLLRECAAAMSEKDSGKIHHLMWMLNELSSPYGDCDQKLASYFLQALFCRATNSGYQCYRTLISAAEKSHSFDSLRRLILKFQEVSPWTTFGHVASNGAVLEAVQSEPRIHIIDMSNTLCTQWPTLLEALATRSDETPSLKLTVVMTMNIAKSTMKEIAARMEKFARLMGVPFEFNILTGPNNQFAELTKEGLGVHEGEAVVVNCIGSLRSVCSEERTMVINLIRSLRPKIVTVVEEEADFSSNREDFLECFEECLRFYTTYFDMLEESFPMTSNEKLMLERECSRSMIRVLACYDNEVDGDRVEENERREKGVQWSERLRRSGFTLVRYSDDVVDDVRALLKRYRAGWSMMLPGDDQDEDQRSGIYLAWKEEPVVWASVWKP